MVQEVTGIRLGESGLPVEPPIRPEPMLAAMGRSVQPQSYLPALDTSALLLDRAGIRRPAVDGPIFDFEPFPSFPTLESWRE
ncbi:hypothetical protein AXF42_Ash021073 [Apostasia shenzhenica]|nr:hypothetical protein AXF42_Ash021073 [Apostasia shenzhenica]